MGDERMLGRVGGLLAIGFLTAALAVPVTALGRVDKVIICHAAGLQDTTQFVTLELSAQAAFGNGGHLYENGTPRAGHEGDHLGPCAGDSTDTTESPVTTTIGDEGTPPTTGATDTTVVTEQDSTTTTTPADPPAEEVESAVETTSTTNPGEVTTTVPGEGSVDDAGEDAGDDSEEPAVVGSTSESAPGAGAGDETETADGVGDTLPFTGPPTALVLPASLLVILGSMAVFVTRGFGPGAGAHVAVDRDRFALGLHRGRHE